MNEASSLRLQQNSVEEYGAPFGPLIDDRRSARLARPFNDAQERPGIMGELLRDATTVEKKILGLAKAIPPEAYAWRPTKGVRPTGEVLLHVAGDNYFLPALLGVTAPAETGIDGRDNKTVARFEARTLRRDEIVTELSRSFAFLKQAMSATSDAALEERPPHSLAEHHDARPVGSTVTHLHEHLGQLSPTPATTT